MLSIALAVAMAIQPGRVVDGVACASDPAQTYAVYLPSNYDPSRQWPLLLVFDARQRGAETAERFRLAAEHHGWIVAASNGARSDDGDDTANERAVRAIWADAPSRFDADRHAIYAAGFSGGAILAWSLAKSAPLAGAILCSGRLDDPREAESATFPWFGTAGDLDFNYIEMHDLAAHSRAAHRVATFAGTHRWPPPELLDEAVGWFASREPGPAMDEEELPFEREARAKIGPAINAFVRNRWSASQLSRALELESLQKKHSKAAGRVLELIYVQLAFYLPRELEQRKLYELTLTSLTVASRIHPDDPDLARDLAHVRTLAARRE